MRDIAQQAGVPLSAVALALSDKPGVSSDRRAAVLRAAEEMGYERVSRPSRPLFGLVMEELSPVARSDGFIDTLIQGVYAAARTMDVQVVLNLYRPGIDPIAELRSLAGRNLDGVLIANGGDITVEVIDEIGAGNLPCVLMENRVDRTIASVSGDNFSAGLVSTNHLLDLGHRRIGMIRGSARYASLRDRYRGYLVALAEAGLPIEQALIHDSVPHAERKGYDEARALLSGPNPPSAIYAVSDKTAFGAAAAIKDLGLEVGRDVSLVGTDNVEAAAYQPTPLTTFDTRSSQLGGIALRALLGLTSRGEPTTHSVLGGGELIVRASSATPR